MTEISSFVPQPPTSQPDYRDLHAGEICWEVGSVQSTCIRPASNQGLEGSFLKKGIHGDGVIALQGVNKWAESERENQKDEIPVHFGHHLEVRKFQDGFKNFNSVS